MVRAERDTVPHLVAASRLAYRDNVSALNDLQLCSAHRARESIEFSDHRAKSCVSELNELLVSKRGSSVCCSS